MEEDIYFVISNSDGDTYIQMMTREVLNQRIKEDYFGEDVSFIETELQSDTNYWPENSVMVIRGVIAKPLTSLHFE